MVNSVESYGTGPVRLRGRKIQRSSKPNDRLSAKRCRSTTIDNERESVRKIQNPAHDIEKIPP